MIDRNTLQVFFTVSSSVSIRHLLLIIIIIIYNSGTIKTYTNCKMLNSNSEDKHPLLSDIKIRIKLTPNRQSPIKMLKSANKHQQELLQSQKLRSLE